MIERWQYEEEERKRQEHVEQLAQEIRERRQMARQHYQWLKDFKHNPEGWQLRTLQTEEEIPED